MESVTGKPAHPEAPEVVLRPATAADMDYVYATWLRSYLQHGVTLAWARNGGQAAKTRYFKGQQALIVRLLGGGAQIEIAGLPGDDTTILGWACWAPGALVEQPVAHYVGTVVHYVYTRQALRRGGVARALLKHLRPTAYTHVCQAPRGERGRGGEWVDWLAEWMRREWPLAVYDPYAVFGG